MQFSGTQPVGAPRENVWQALNDADVLKRCIPGCQELTQTSTTEMAAKVVLKIGPIKATFISGVSLADFDPPNGYVIVGEGKGGVEAIENDRCSYWKPLRNAVRHFRAVAYSSAGFSLTARCSIGASRR